MQSGDVAVTVAFVEENCVLPLVPVTEPVNYTFIFRRTQLNAGFSLLHDVGHQVGDRLVAEQSGAHQHVILVGARLFPCRKIEREPAAGEQWGAIVAKIFDNSADRCCNENRINVVEIFHEIQLSTNTIKSSISAQTIYPRNPLTQSIVAERAKQHMGAMHSVSVHGGNRGVCCIAFVIILHPLEVHRCRK